MPTTITLMDKTTTELRQLAERERCYIGSLYDQGADACALLEVGAVGAEDYQTAMDRLNPIVERAEKRLSTIEFVLDMREREDREYPGVL